MYMIGCSELLNAIAAVGEVGGGGGVEWWLAMCMIDTGFCNNLVMTGQSDPLFVPVSCDFGAPMRMGPP